MSNLFDIGRSGLQSYRRALAVTGQNIANVNTEGYKRREADLHEVSGIRGDVYGVSSNAGLGVRVNDVKRSFDEFLLNKVRDATASTETSTTYLRALEQIQAILMPGDSNIGTSLEQFFAGLHDISNLPAEMGPRIVAKKRGEAVAENFNEVARTLRSLKEGLATQARQGVSDLNGLATSLANVNSQLTSSDSGSSKSLLDNRDKLIDKMSKYAQVNVTLDNQGRATIRLGQSIAGPKIVEASRSINISMENVDNRLVYKVGLPGQQTTTNQIINGSLAGYSDGYRTVFETQGEIDELAFSTAQQLNEVHHKGLNLDGNQGGDLFLSNRPIVEIGVSNVGQSYAEVDVDDISSIAPKAVTFTYADATGKWTATDRLGTKLATGGATATLPGMTLRFFGEPFDGDQIIIDPTRAAAEGMTFALQRGEEFAAASTRLVYSGSSNASTADLVVTDTTGPAASGLDDVKSLFGNSISTIASTSFLTDGAVSVVPGNIDNLDIVSLFQQSVAKFTIADDSLSTVSSMVLVSEDASGNQTTATFSLNHASFSDTGTGWPNASEIADLLNVGAITGTLGDGSSVSLADLGGQAAGSGGALSISLGSNDFVSGTVTYGSGSTVTAELTAQETTASNIQIFTREGRHIAGSALSASDQASLLTVANGFDAAALYNSTYLNTDGGYLGVGVSHKSTSTENLITSTVSGAGGTFDFLRLGDIDATISASDGKAAHYDTSSYTLTVEGVSKTVTVTDFGKDASHADVAAAMIKKFRDDAPIAALTGTAVSSIPANGTSVSVSFENNQYQISMVDDEVVVTGGEEGRLRAFFGKDKVLYVSSTSGTISSSNISVLSESNLSGNSTAATAFGLTAGGTGTLQTVAGFSTYGFELTINGARISATLSDGSATMSASVSGASAVGERITLTNLPDEELLILVNGGGARKLAASYDTLPEGTPVLPRDVTVKVLDASAGTVEFIDTATSTSLATRTLDSEQVASAVGLNVNFSGSLIANDEFFISANSNADGDARNLLALTDLQNSSNGRGGFQEVFAGMISEIGSTLQSTAATNEAAKQLRDASIEVESSFSGVSLDSEAANLIQQQQAYQASARILSAAREIFQVLLDAV